MNSNVMPLYEQMAKEELQGLTAEVKETVATQETQDDRKFGSIDLWNRQRQMKQVRASFSRKWELS